MSDNKIGSLEIGQAPTQHRVTLPAGMSEERGKEIMHGVMRETERRFAANPDPDPDAVRFMASRGTFGAFYGLLAGYRRDVQAVQSQTVKWNETRPVSALLSHELRDHPECTVDMDTMTLHRTVTMRLAEYAPGIFGGTQYRADGQTLLYLPTPELDAFTALLRGSTLPTPGVRPLLLGTLPGSPFTHAHLDLLRFGCALLGMTQFIVGEPVDRPFGYGALFVDAARPMERAAALRAAAERLYRPVLHET